MPKQSLVRVRMDPTGESDWDPLYLDAFIDESGQVNTAIPSHGLFGNWAVNRASVWPFIYRPSVVGKLDRCDFGTQSFDCEFTSDLPDAIRFSETNFSKKKVVVGEFVTFWYGGEEQCYRISSIAPLLENVI